MASTPVWYFQTYRNRWPDFLLLPDDAVAHYHLNARHFSLSPNLAFDEFWYRRRYTDVESLVRSGAVATGWHHYLEAGCIERRNPTWWFDERWYVSKNIEASQALQSGQFACGFEHYLLYGMKNNLSPSLYLIRIGIEIGTSRRMIELPICQCSIICGVPAGINDVRCLFLTRIGTEQSISTRKNRGPSPR